MAERRFPGGQVLLPGAGLGRRRLTQLSRRPQRGLQALRAVGVPLADRPGQGPDRLGQPVLQVRPGPADLAGDQARSFTAQVLPGRTPARLPGKPAANRRPRRSGVSREHVGGPVGTIDALGQKHRADRVLRAQRKDLPVDGRGIPLPGLLMIRELDHDQGAGVFSLQHLHLAAVHDEVAAERCQRRIDLLKVFPDGRPHPNVAQDPHRVPLHDDLLHRGLSLILGSPPAGCHYL